MRMPPSVCLPGAGCWNLSVSVCVRRGDEVLLLQVFLQPGQQPGLQSTGRQGSLLLQQRLQREQLCLPSPAGTQRPAAAAAAAGGRLTPPSFQIDAVSQRDAVLTHRWLWCWFRLEDWGRPRWMFVWPSQESRCLFQWISRRDAWLTCGVKEVEMLF